MLGKSLVMKQHYISSDLLKNRIMKKLVNILRYYQIYLMILPALIYVIVFRYLPMYGVQIAFKDFRTSLGIWDSPWVGFRHFIKFLNYPEFWRILKNTLTISVYQLVVGFPIPIILAIMINEIKGTTFKKTVQMVTYAPHFISMVVLCGMLTLFLNRDMGIINHLVSFLGGSRTDYLSDPRWFKTLYVLSEVWQNAGWGTIIYLAALSGVDVQVIESARMDGANRFQKIRYVDFPSIVPTMVILLIMNVGNILSVGFEKVLLLQNSLNMESSDIIATYVYRIGLLGGQFSYTAAIGLFNNIINLILLITVNQISRKLSETSLW